MLGGSIILPATAPVICPCGDAGLTPEWLKNELVSIFGLANIIGLWIGEDILFDTNNRIAGWPARIGPPLAKWNTSNSYPIRNVRNGRLGTINNQALTTITALLATFSATPLSMWSVALSNEIPVVDAYNVLIRGNPHAAGDSTWLVTDAAGSSNFYNSWGTKYRDAVSTLSIDTNLHVYASDYATNTVNGITIFGYQHTGNSGWQGEAYFFMSLAVMPTPVQRAKAVVALKRYYNILITADELKVASLPVDNPVVVAPLRTAIQSYGTVNSAFTLMGTPTIGADGLTCLPGSSSGARITTGWSSDFTVSVRAKMLQLGGFAEAGMWSTMQPTSFFAGGWGVAPGANPGYFGMTVPGVGSYSTTVANDLVFHTFTLRRSGTTTELYIDGVLRDSRNTGTLNGTVLVLGGILLNNVFSAITNGVFKNNVQYHSALSPTNQALVEAWVAAA